MTTSAVETHPWSVDALFAKAQLFVEQMDSSDPNDWKYGLWSALSLELLAKASLANISPTLLLTDTKKWQSLVYAISRNYPVSEESKQPSISIQEVFKRLEILIPDFKEMKPFCSEHIDRRNAELHSGESAFKGLGDSKWLPKYYKSCKILLKSLDKELDDFVSNPNKAQEYINSLNDAETKAVEQDIQKHSEEWKAKSEDERDAVELKAQTWATRDAGHRTQCPACSSPALLQGSPTGPVTKTIKDDKIIRQQDIFPTHFECIACGLKITGFSKLSACGLGDYFKATKTYTAAEFFDLYTEDDLESARDEAREEERYDHEDDYNE